MRHFGFKFLISLDFCIVMPISSNPQVSIFSERVDFKLITAPLGLLISEMEGQFLVQDFPYL